VNWNAVSAFAELLASLGVIVSLIYVSVQIRQNSRVTETSNYQQIMEYQNSVITTIIDNADAANIYNRGLESFLSLSEDEKTRFHMMMTPIITGSQMNFQLHNRRLMDDELFEGQRSSFLKMFDSPGVREWWQSNKMWFHKDFVAYLDSFLHEEST
jgi:hypothetical protein